MRSYLFLISGFILAFILETAIQQRLWLWLQPEWVLLLIFYWLIYQPQYFSIGSCFMVGLIADLVYGTLLGKHVLIYLVTGFFIINFHRRICLYHLWKLSAMVFMLTLTYLLFNFLITHSTDLWLSIEVFSLPVKALITSIVWAVVVQFTHAKRLVVLHD